MSPIKILIAEDDMHIRNGLVDTLESEGYHVIEAENGIQALDVFEKNAVDLLLLDVMMPGKSGYDVCQAVRTRDKTIPVIMLTAKGEEIDKVVGLKLGADDYITKPFGIHELLARIEAVLRRSFLSKTDTPQNQTPFTFSRFTVDPKTYTLMDQEGHTTDISKRELDLLRLFADHPGEVLDRDTLLNKIWGIDYTGTTRTLDQHIAVLRKKIETDPGAPTVIKTVHGIGYRFIA
ncbi:MAG: DNA-binding response regulator [Desulfobacterales bacterium]|nr:MAG: DNA-binding response regulator [Desulfobacterales bacterium]